MMKLRNPLSSLRAEVDRRLDRFETVVGALERYVLRVLDPVPVPSPFVAVLIEAEQERRQIVSFARAPCGEYRIAPQPGEPTQEALPPPEWVPFAAGISKRLGDKLETLQIQAQVPLRNGRVVVFCDLDRVAFHGIFRGNDLIVGSIPGECPVGYFANAEPGVMIRVLCQHRK